MGDAALVEVALEPLVDDPLMGCVHVDDDQTVGVLREDVKPLELRKRKAQAWNRGVARIGRMGGSGNGEAHGSRHRLDVGRPRAVGACPEGGAGQRARKPLGRAGGRREKFHDLRGAAACRGRGRGAPCPASASRVGGSEHARIVTTPVKIERTRVKGRFGGGLGCRARRIDPPRRRTRLREAAPEGLFDRVIDK